jgi:hypothetical protein
MEIASNDGSVLISLSSEQRQIALFICAAILAHCPIIIFGESGSCKTHLV